MFIYLYATWKTLGEKREQKREQNTEQHFADQHPLWAKGFHLGIKLRAYFGILTNSTGRSKI